MIAIDLELQAVREELAVEARRLAECERADAEGRVACRDEWLRSLARRRGRVTELERLLDELVALEESASELTEDYRHEVGA